MGIDIHALNFLKYAKSKKFFGDTLTIGRQGIYVKELAVKKIIKEEGFYSNSKYCEELLTKYFGAKKVESIDFNAYEGATHIHDMNYPIPNHLIGKFDTIFDGGCLEHIFNIPQALKNCSLFCRPGGQIIHVLPANNYCGHGFYQFSPELFFSLYSINNGYSNTEIFLAELSDIKKWYSVKRPANGNRVDVMSKGAVHVLVRTTLTGNKFNQSEIQQSDYVYEWDELNSNKKIIAPNKIIQFIKKIPLVYDFLSPIYHLYLQKNLDNKLNKNNKGLTSLNVINIVD